MVVSVGNRMNVLSINCFIYVRSGYEAGKGQNSFEFNVKTSEQSVGQHIFQGAIKFVFIHFVTLKFLKLPCYATVCTRSLALLFYSHSIRMDNISGHTLYCMPKNSSPFLVQSLNISWTYNTSLVLRICMVLSVTLDPETSFNHNSLGVKHSLIVLGPVV